MSELDGIIDDVKNQTIERESGCLSMSSERKLVAEIERLRRGQDFKLQGPRREEVARVLEMVADDGLKQPRDLDVALDAIESAYLHSPND